MQQLYRRDPRERFEAIVLTVIFGPLGLHLFYLRRYASGLTYMLNFAAYAAITFSFAKALFNPIPVIVVAAVLVYSNAWLDLRKLREFIEEANTLRVRVKRWDVIRAHFSPMGILGAQYYVIGNPLRGFIYTITGGGLLILWLRDYFVHFRFEG